MKYERTAANLVGSLGTIAGGLALWRNLHYLRDPWLLPLSGAWLAALLGCHLLVRSRLRRKPESRPPLLPGVLLVASTAGMVEIGLSPPFLLAALEVIAASMIWFLYHRTVALILALLLAAAVTAAGLLAAHPGEAALAGTWMLGATLLGRWLDAEFDQWEIDTVIYARARQAAGEFVSVNVRLQDTIDRTSGVTRMRERARVAREIHDSVGYTLTALLMQVQAAQDVLRLDPKALAPRLQRLEEIIRSSIQEVRAEVSDLRDESIVEKTGASRWKRLCDSFADGTGVRVHTVIPESLERVAPAISETVYRIVQETLTNAYRHGGADYIDVSMAWEQERGRILLRVSDNGQGASQIRAGNGLRGIRERVTQLDGSVVWQSQAAKGFDLGVEIPWGGFVDG